jgi:hypothetical protein
LQLVPCHVIERAPVTEAARSALVDLAWFVTARDR